MGKKVIICCDRCDSILNKNEKFIKMVVSSYAVNNVGECDIPDYSVIKYLCGECHQEVINEVLRIKRIVL